MSENDTSTEVTLEQSRLHLRQMLNATVTKVGALFPGQEFACTDTHHFPGGRIKVTTAFGGQGQEAKHRTKATIIVNNVLKIGAEVLDSKVRVHEAVKRVVGMLQWTHDTTPETQANTKLALAKALSFFEGYAL